MSINTQAIAARNQAEANLLQLLVALASAETALSTSEPAWLLMPITERSVAGEHGSDSESYSSWIGYWNTKRTSTVAAIEALERLINSLNKRIQTQQPFMHQQIMTVKV